MKGIPSATLIVAVAVGFLTGCDDRNQRSENGAAQSQAPGVKSPQAEAAGGSIPSGSNDRGKPETAAGIDKKKVASDVLSLVGVEGMKQLNEEQWRLIKERYWCSAFDRPISKSQGSEMPLVTGLLKSSASSTEPFVTQLLTGNFKTVTDPLEKEALIALHYSAMAAAMGGGHALPAAMNELSSKDTVTLGDAYLFEIFSDAFVDINNKRPVTHTEFSNWATLSSSQNPLTRLLALRTFRNVSLDIGQQLQFYDFYTKESEPQILAQLVTQLFQLADPGSQVLLGKLKANQKVSESPHLAEQVQKAESRLGKILKSR